MKPFSHRGRHTSSLVNNEDFHLKLSPETMGVVVQSGRFVVFYNQVHINSTDVEPLPDSDYEKSLQKARRVPVERYISVEDVPLSLSEIRTVLRRGWLLLNDNEPAMKKFNDSLKRRSQESEEQTNEQETN